MSIKRLGLSVFIVLCMMFLTCMVGFASDTGSVKGKLHKNSASGSALSGAKVTCGGESDKTDNDGKFKIKGIKKGEHTIKFSKDGYESYQTTVKIKAGETANVGDRWLTQESSSQTSTTAKCPSGNGIYCGDSGKGQNTGYLYQCTNGAYSLKTSCSNGCQKNAAGKDDSCKALSSPSPTPTPTPTPVPSPSQSVGSVSGKVHKNSASGTVLSGVDVKCGGKSYTTGIDGTFKLKEISAGNQSISFSKQGYESFQTMVPIAAGHTANMGDRWLTEKVSTGSVSGKLRNDVVEKSGPIDFKALQRIAYPGPKDRKYCYPQCVDFVRDTLKITHTGNASTFWTDRPAGWNKNSNGSSSKPPKAGDILVWEGNKANGGNGHVALVRKVDVSKQLIERTDANYSSDYLRDCIVRTHQMSIRKNGNVYTIGGSGSDGLYGWLSKD